MQDVENGCEAKPTAAPSPGFQPTGGGPAEMAESCRSHPQEGAGGGAPMTHPTGGPLPGPSAGPMGGPQAMPWTAQTPPWAAMPPHVQHAGPAFQAGPQYGPIGYGFMGPQSPPVHGHMPGPGYPPAGPMGPFDAMGPAAGHPSGHACSCDHGPTHGPGHLKHDAHQNQYGQWMELVNDLTTQGNTDPSRLMACLGSLDTPFWKGAIVGVAAALLLTNNSVKKAIFGLFKGSPETPDA